MLRKEFPELAALKPRFGLPATSPLPLAVRRLNGPGSMWRLRKSHPKERGLYPRTATDQAVINFVNRWRTGKQRF
jgi:hypothetical protein